MSEDNCSFCGHGKKYHVWDPNLLGMTCLGNDNDCSCGRNFAPSLSEYNQLVSERDALKDKSENELFGDVVVFFPSTKSSKYVAIPEQKYTNLMWKVNQLEVECNKYKAVLENLYALSAPGSVTYKIINPVLKGGEK